MSQLSELLGASFAVIYPGQGSQVVGMGDDLLASSEAARDLYAAADQILGAPLSQIMHEGPDDVLADTFNAQPALLTHSIAAWQAAETLLAAEGLRPSMTAGHSLGEFTSLVTADVLDFPTALTLVRERGRLMKEAGEKRPGGMAAILGLDDDALIAVCAEASSEGIINVANANCPGQTVISGEVVALEKAMELAKAAGAKRAQRLNVSIASHSPLMADVSAELNRLLDNIDLRDPQFPVIGNTTGEPITTADGVRAELRHQVELPVQWTTSVRTMVDAGVQTFVELGAGAVLAGLIKRIDRNVKTVSLADLKAATE
ncbi:MAG: ACP S-malonyltransferase [Thermomicrobiales bacterium]